MAYADSWLEVEKSLGGRSALGGTTEEMRAQFAGLVEFLLPQYPKPSDKVTTRDGSTDGVNYRIYTPTKAAQKGPLPVGVWTHGGGLMIGNLDSEDLLCRVVAELVPSIIVSVDYRLAPEHKAPAQLWDSLSIFKWAHLNAASFGGDANKMYTIGSSAGGTLALQIANTLVADPEKRSFVKGVIAMVPATAHWETIPAEYAAMYKAYEVNAENVPVINKESMNLFYKAAAVDPTDKTAFVILDEENHKNYPPTYFISCEMDPLRDDAYVMEAALKKAGVPTQHDHFKGQPHVFWIFPSIPEGADFVGKLIGGVSWILSQC